MLEDYRINGIAKIASAETGFITAVDTLRPDATVVKGAFVASCFDDALNTTSCALFRIRQSQSAILTPPLGCKVLHLACL